MIFNTINMLITHCKEKIREIGEKLKAECNRDNNNWKAIKVNLLGDWNIQTKKIKEYETKIEEIKTKKEE